MSNPGRDATKATMTNAPLAMPALRGICLYKRFLVASSPLEGSWFMKLRTIRQKPRDRHPVARKRAWTAMVVARILFTILKD
jgi:hypothetical protein